MTADYALVGTDCPLSPAMLAPGGSCLVTIVFGPTVPGVRLGTLVVDTAAGTSTVLLSGTGVTPTATLTPVTLMFADQRLDTASTVQTATLTSTGLVALHVLAVTVSGDYALSKPGCPATLAPGGSCALDVTFQPLGNGARGGILTVTTDAGVLTSSLTGTGTGILPKSAGGGWALIGAQKERVEWSLRASRPGAVKGKMLVVRFNQDGASYVFTATRVTTLTVTLGPGGGTPATSHFEGSGTLERNGSPQAGPFTFSFDSTDNASPGAGLDTFAVSIDGTDGFHHQAGSPAGQLVLAFGELGNLMI